MTTPGGNEDEMATAAAGAERTRRHVRAHGRVQGVYFRASVADRAWSLGVDGWVRNVPDGSVEAVFDGPVEAVERMVDYCAHGPADARVEGLRVEEGPAGDLPTGFEVR